MLKMVVVAVVVSGCALTMQEHLPDEYDARTEPRCSASRGWATLDAIQILPDLAVAVIAAVPPNGEEGSPAISALFGVSALIDAISMVSGIGWARDCERAREAHDRLMLEEQWRRQVR